MSSGHGGISIGGSLSAAPRGIIFLLAGAFNSIEGGDVLSCCGCDIAGIDPLRNVVCNRLGCGIGGIGVVRSDFEPALGP